MGQYSKFGNTLFLALAFLLISSTFAFATTIYVKTDGLDTNDGLSWDTAKQTVQAGLNTAVSGNEVWVAGGTYVERITLTDGVALYGGYSGVGTTRDILVNVTTIDGNQGGSVVTAPPGAGLSTVIDGFTVRNGNATYGGGIYCSSASPTISGNTIRDNTASWDGGGLYCGASATPLISENTITGNIATGHEGGGICSNNASPTIRCNTVVQNSTANAGAGIACSSGGSPVIDRNLIQDNTASGNGGGVHCYYSSPGVTNNIIKGNAGAVGGGLLCYNSAAVIANNTFVSNTATGPANGGGGAFCAESTATFLGNIIAFGSSGIGVYNSTLSLSNNCVYGNSADNYSGLSPGSGDISQDPLFVDRATGDYHLTPSSPCIDAGTNSGTPATDNQGRVRPQDGDGDGTFVCDIGAYEYRGVYVKWDSPGPTLDGKSWATAYHSVQEGLNSAISPDEVWVGAGTYVENITLKDGVGLYGGFAGTETSRDQRNWTANVTILDGNQAGSVVASPSGATATTVIDGFTIRNGESSFSGGGIYCSYSSPAISNNTITANSAEYGGGIYCYSSSPTITNNTITGNSASWLGGGIYCSSSPAISNNTITGNSAQYGGGIYCYNYSPTISNNIVAFNSSGVYRQYATPVLRNNCVYGNTAYNYWELSPGSGDISADPQLSDRANGDYHIEPTSPCVDAGWDAAVQPGWLDMDGEPRIYGAHVDIGADEWTLRVATPAFSPSGGVYNAPQTVMITCATADAVIHYTTNGNDPTESDPSVTGPVVVDTSLTLKAKAWKTDWTPSAIRSAAYTIQVATPAFSPDGGEYDSPRSVTITCGTQDAVIHYTTNGATPTESDPVATDPVTVDRTMTLKARAYKTGWSPSNIASASYYIVIAIPSLKMAANGVSVTVNLAIVSAAFSDFFYIESEDRACGLRVAKTSHGLSAGMRAEVVGTMRTYSSGERYVEATTAVQSPPPDNTGSVEPLALTNSAVGGGDWNYSSATGAGQVGVKGNANLNNIGLLLTVPGRVTYSSSAYFVISDGSNVTDPSGYRGVRVMATGLTRPSVSQYVMVTGVSSIFNSGTDYYPFIRARTQADIVVLQ